MANYSKTIIKYDIITYFPNQNTDFYCTFVDKH